MELCSQAALEGYATLGGMAFFSFLCHRADSTNWATFCEVLIIWLYKFFVKSNVFGVGEGNLFSLTSSFK